jgi:hypothetical protein
VIAENSKEGNAATPVTAADTEPADVTGIHQLFGADLEQALIGMGSATLPTQTGTPAPAPSLSRPNRGIQPAAAADTPARNVLELPAVEPWPDPVIGSDVLNATAETFSRYVVLPEGAADALALWAAHTHCFESFQCTPRLNLSSPEKGCGKSTLRDVMGLLVPRPLPTEHLTPAVLFRLVAEHQPTVLADECDAWLLEHEQLRGMLNAGHRRGGQVLRYDGSLRAVRGFSVFAPVVLCGIGKLPVTLHDRSIIIPLLHVHILPFQRSAVTQSLASEVAEQDQSKPLRFLAHGVQQLCYLCRREDFAFTRLNLGQLNGRHWIF